MSVCNQKKKSHTSEIRLNDQVKRSKKFAIFLEYRNQSIFFFSFCATSFIPRMSWYMSLWEKIK